MTAPDVEPLDPPPITGTRLAVIAGSGIDEAALETFPVAPVDAESPFGRISGLLARLDTGDEVVLVRRHHVTGTFAPAHLVDHRRTIAGLAALGCDRVLALGSVGGLRWPLGTIVAPFDFFAPWTSPSFFADARGHTVPAFDVAWRDRIVATWEAVTSTPIIDGGVYAQMTGPRLETPSEVRFLAQHADVVGMTIASEAILAGEAGLAYAPVCVVDNVANGLATEALTVDALHAGVATNRTRLLADLHALVPALAPPT